MTFRDIVTHYNHYYIASKGMLIEVITWYLLLTCPVVLVGAQSCEPFKGSPLTSHVCDQFVGPNVCIIHFHIIDFKLIKLADICSFQYFSS